MYIKHFRLKGRPYAPGPEPQFFVPNPAIGTIATRLAEVMTGSGSMAVVSGGPGVGKTALVSHAANQAGDGAVVAWADLRQLEFHRLTLEIDLLKAKREAGS